LRVDAVFRAIFSDDGRGGEATKIRKRRFGAALEQARWRRRMSLESSRRGLGGSGRAAVPLPPVATFSRRADHGHHVADRNGLAFL
jgi:hypothetical protein